MTDMREVVARALAKHDRIEICSDASYALSSYGPKADAALSLMQPEIDRRVAEERAKLLERLRGLSDELEDDFTDAIGDSLDVDWGPRDGARNCVIAFNLTLAKFEKENSDG